MGSQIFHYKACIERTIFGFNPKHISLKIFENKRANVASSYFEKFFQSIEYKEIKRTIWITDNEELYLSAIKRRESPYDDFFSCNYDYPYAYANLFHHKDNDTLNQNINHYTYRETIKDNSFTDSSIKYLSEIPFINERHSSGWIERIYYIPKYELGFYYKEIATYHKDVNEKFNQYFNPRNISLYALKEDFSKLRKCIDNRFCDNPSFYRKFTKHFEENKSFLWMTT
jgi:hypothetical protein